MTNIKSRLNHLESVIDDYRELTSLLNKAYYDEITEEEKNLYCNLCGISREAFEEVNIMVLGDLHILLQKFDKPTPEELEELRSENNLIATF